MKFYTFNSGNNLIDKIKFWLTTFLVIWGLSFLGLGWIVNSVFILVGILIALPVISVIGLQWWIGRNLVVDSCPACQHTSTATAKSQFYCPNCGESLQIEGRKFVRISTPGTIDIEVQVID